MGHLKHRPAIEGVISLNTASHETNETKHLTRTEETLHRVEKLAASQHYQKAIDLLSAAGCDRQLLNAKGVCLLRLGRNDEAVRVFHDLVLNSGCMWMRPGVPTVYKTNYGTALLLSGHLSGCVDILTEIQDEQNATVQQLRAAIKRWESQLTFWQNLNWRLSGIDPANRPVTIDFVPGEFDFGTRNELPRPNTNAASNTSGMPDSITSRKK